MMAEGSTTDRARFANRIRALTAAGSRHTPTFRGKQRFFRRFDAWMLRLAGGPSPLALHVDGVRYVLETEDVIDFRVAYFTNHDRAVVIFFDREVRRLAPPHQVLWDVGANVGSVTLPLTHRNPALHVEAFEPSPAVTARLRRNLERNPSLATRIRLHEVALCNAVGSIDFYASAESSNRGIGTLMRGHNTQVQPVRVPAYTADDILRREAARPPALIKIDVEGFEYEVLCGLRQYLAERRDLVLLFEHEPSRIRARARDMTTLACELLRDQGYSLFALTALGTLEPLRPHLLARHADLVARGPACRSD